jgi:hypothetical protein
MPEFIWLNEVVSVPLKQALRHPGAFHHSFFARRTRYPQFCHKDSTKSAEFTSSGLTCRDGQLKRAKMGGSLEAVWSYYLPSNPGSVTVTREPDGTTLFKVDPTFPSTRTCSAAVTSEPALPLSVRELAWFNCGPSRDVDTTGLAGIACGECVVPLMLLYSRRSSMKKELGLRSRENSIVEVAEKVSCDSVSNSCCLAIFMWSVTGSLQVFLKRSF